MCEFYPSITEELLLKALDFASQHTNITEKEIEAIMHTKKTLLHESNNIWCKSTSTFDVTMGSFDGAEACEIVGTYLLSQLNHLDINVGLYRDDGLATCCKTPLETEKIKKEICRIFHANNLKITIEANKKVVDYLDISLDLNTGLYKPYSKPNNKVLYVHKESNHPPAILKNIPLNINNRLAAISSNQTVFEQSIKQYDEALKESGYKYKLKFEKPNEENNSNSRKRKILWFNPPYSETVATNIGKKFLQLIDEHFPKENKLHKIFNRNSTKVSYSTMPNLQQIIDSHNKSKLRRPKDPTTNLCNCRQPTSCPIENKCLDKSIIYQATVHRNDNSTQETYIGLTEGTFKQRYTTHKHSFSNSTRRHVTALSKHIWQLKDNNINYTISWKIIAHARPYSTASKTCNLCLTEKYFILFKPEMSTLNSRNELASSCRHRKKHLLCNYNQ